MLLLESLQIVNKIDLICSNLRPGRMNRNARARFLPRIISGILQKKKGRLLVLIYVRS